MADCGCSDNKKFRFIWIPAVVYLFATGMFIKDAQVWRQFPLDDAWIHRVYSRSFAEGHGFAYNDGIQEAGSSSPLWTIVSAPCHWMEAIDPEWPVPAVKILGILLGLVSVLMVHRIVGTMTGSAFAAAISASLFAVEPRLLFSSFSGMETNLLIALLIGACLAILNHRRWLFLILVGLAPAARPEAVLFLPLALPVISSFRCSGRPIARAAIAGLLLLLPIVGWSIFCFSVNGRFLPNTFYIKATPASFEFSLIVDGLKAAVQSGAVPGWVLLAGIVLFCLLCCRLGQAAIPPFAFLLAVPAIYIFAVVFSRKFELSGYYWTRWTDPGSLLIAVAASIGWGWLLGSQRFFRSDEVNRKYFSRTTRIGVRLMFSIVLVLTLIPAFIERRDRIASDCHAIETINVTMGRWINGNTRPDAVVSVNDAGAIRYFGDRYTIDLGGLNNSDIALKKMPLWMAVSQSDWLVIFPGFLTPEILAHLAKEFEIRFTTTLSAEEYTVSPVTTDRLYNFAMERTGRKNIGN